MMRPGTSGMMGQLGTIGLIMRALIVMGTGSVIHRI